MFDVWDRAHAGMKPDDQPEHPFNKNCKVSFTETMMIVESDGIPNHKTAKYPNADNPNRIEKQHYRFEIPRHPKIADKPTPTPMGPIGVAVNGIPFYNQYNREGQDAVKLEVFDSCCGHPDPGGRYHYHKFPVCVKSPFKDTPGKHSPLIGYAFDGFGIYGPRGEKRQAADRSGRVQRPQRQRARLSLPRHGRISLHHRRLPRRAESADARAARWPARRRTWAEVRLADVAVHRVAAGPVSGLLPEAVRLGFGPPPPGEGPPPDKGF